MNGEVLKTMIKEKEQMGKVQGGQKEKRLRLHEPPSMKLQKVTGSKENL